MRYLLAAAVTVACSFPSCDQIIGDPPVPDDLHCEEDLSCGATIGGTPVPDDLHCEEDELIGFYGVPDTLACLHPDDLEPVE